MGRVKEVDRALLASPVPKAIGSVIVDNGFEIQISRALTPERYLFEVHLDQIRAGYEFEDPSPDMRYFYEVALIF